MNVYYCKTSKWEVEYFQNEVFKKEVYGIDVNFIFFDNKTQIVGNQSKNIIVTNRGISLYFLENMITKLKPFVIFHLSDEAGKEDEYYNLYNRPFVKVLFHQYNHENIDYKINNIQIPLGYVSGFLSDNASFNYKQQKYGRKYDFSFIGSLKSDRRIMLNKFKNNFKNSHIDTGITKWNNPHNQRVQPDKLFNIYTNSFFVPIGRGNKSLDCFRLYEAIVAGAIPVICGSFKEFNITFKFNDSPPPSIIVGETWDEAITICKKIYNDEDKICEIITSNHVWFQKQTMNISKKIISLL